MLWLVQVVSRPAYGLGLCHAVNHGTLCSDAGGCRPLTYDCSWMPVHFMHAWRHGEASSVGPSRDLRLPGIMYAPHSYRDTCLPQVCMSQSAFT